jgi:N-methylhydantoinase B/oxoprolinase/acetone carboxylase alpha subunit
VSTHHILLCFKPTYSVYSQPFPTYAPTNTTPSHLPDITIITPVFDPRSESKWPIFFTASRGHHADIGGILPGSMPPTSTSLREEGAEIVSLKIVSKGRFDSEGLMREMVKKPARWPGSSGCRNIRDVESDLKAVRILFQFCPLLVSKYTHWRL